MKIEHHVMMKAEIGAGLLHVKKRQDGPPPRELRNKLETDSSPEPPEREWLAFRL